MSNESTRPVYAVVMVTKVARTEHRNFYRVPVVVAFFEQCEDEVTREDPQIIAVYTSPFELKIKTIERDFEVTNFDLVLGHVWRLWETELHGTYSASAEDTRAFYLCNGHSFKAAPKKSRIFPSDVAKFVTIFEGHRPEKIDCIRNHGALKNYIEENLLQEEMFKPESEESASSFTSEGSGSGESEAEEDEAEEDEAKENEVTETEAAEQEAGEARAPPAVETSQDRTPTNKRARSPDFIR